MVLIFDNIVSEFMDVIVSPGVFLVLLGCVCGVIGAIMVKFIVSFFARLEKDKECRVAEFTFESPNSLKRIPAPSLFDDKASKSLSVVIPAYNEEDRLPSTLEETVSYLQRRRDACGPSFTYEVIVVDDGSKDDTSRVAFDYVKKHGVDAVRLLTLPHNRGKGHAVKAGIMCSRGKEVLFMDADGATGVSEIEKLETRLQRLVGDGGGSKDSQQQQKSNEDGAGYSPYSWERVGGRGSLVEQRSLAEQKKLLSGRVFEEKAGFVLGSRAHLQNAAMAKRTALRNVLMHGFHALVTLVIGNSIRDTQCGFKLMTRKAAQMIVPNQRLQRWAFDVELVHIAQSLKVPMDEVQVVWTEIPGSKVRMTSIAHIAFELAMIKIGYGIGAWSVELNSPGSTAAQVGKNSKKAQ